MMNRKVGDCDPGFRFWVTVRPRARRVALRRTSTGEIRFETTAPPIEGNANEALIDYLARALHMPRGVFEIKVGAKSRKKLIEIAGVEAKAMAERFNSLFEAGEKIS